jgi:hypothetical protein
VQRLEQVRLPGAVLADREHEPGREAQLERGVGAVVAERERADDQSARGTACGAGFRTFGLGPFVRRK